MGPRLSNETYLGFVNANPTLRGTGFQSSDPRWIGAWWLGFAVLGLLLTCYAFVLAAFPRRLVSANHKKEATEAETTPPTISASVASMEVAPPEEEEDRKSSINLLNINETLGNMSHNTIPIPRIQGLLLPHPH